MVKIEFKKGNAIDTALQARIVAMRELKEKKVLRLTVCKKWFEMIVAGTKKEEYREIKAYWAKRLTTNCECSYDVANEHYCGEIIYRPFTHVLFINGYNKNSPKIEKKIKEICIGFPQKGLCPEKWLKTVFFIIKFE
jgi:hypothetical protein